MLSSGDRGRGGEPLLLRRYLRSGGSGGRDGDNNSPPNSKWWWLLLFSLSICETLTFRLLVLFSRAIFGICGPVLIPFTISKIHLNFQQMKFKDHFWIRISHKKKINQIVILNFYCLLSILYFEFSRQNLLLLLWKAIC